MYALQIEDYHKIYNLHIATVKLKLWNNLIIWVYSWKKWETLKGQLKHWLEKGTKQMYDILKRGKFHNLSISCQFELFDKVVKIILLYGNELWNCDIIKRVYLKYCKLLLNLKFSTPNCMIYGELGRCPLHIDIKQRMLLYWTKLITRKQSTFCSVVHRLMYHLRNTQNAICSWLNSKQTILNECVFRIFGTHTFSYVKSV